jgi:hypothetical protein
MNSILIHSNRMASCGGLATRLLAVVRSRPGRLTIGRRLNNLPRIAASRKRGVLDISEIWPIDNRPQATSLPHTAGDPKFVAAREETKM